MTNEPKLAPLLPCPNPGCGSEMYMSMNNDGRWWLRCPKCILETPIATSEAQAIAFANALPRAQPAESTADKIARAILDDAKLHAGKHSLDLENPNNKIVILKESVWLSSRDDELSDLQLSPAVAALARSKWVSLRAKQEGAK